MSKPKDTETNASTTDAVVEIDASQNKNEIAIDGKFADCHHPISDERKARLKDAKKQLARARANDSAQAIKHWKTQVKELNQVKLLDSVIEQVLCNLQTRSDTIVATGKFNPNDGQPTFHKLVGRDGKLGGRVEDIEYDGKPLSVLCEEAVENRKLAFQESDKAQAVMRTFGGHQNTTYLDVPERESITIQPNGKIDMEMKVTFKAHDIRSQLEDGIANGQIAHDAIDVLPLKHS